MPSPLGKLQIEQGNESRRSSVVDFQAGEINTRVIALVLAMVMACEIAPFTLLFFLPAAAGLHAGVWEAQPENSHAAQHALSICRSLMQTHNGSNDRQTKTRPTLSTGATRVDTVEAVKQVR